MKNVLQEVNGTPTLIHGIIEGKDYLVAFIDYGHYVAFPVSAHDIYTVWEDVFIGLDGDTVNVDGLLMKSKDIFLAEIDFDSDAITLHERVDYPYILENDGIHRFHTNYNTLYTEQFFDSAKLYELEEYNDSEGEYYSYIVALFPKDLETIKKMISEANDDENRYSIAPNTLNREKVDLINAYCDNCYRKRVDWYTLEEGWEEWENPLWKGRIFRKIEN